MRIGIVTPGISASEQDWCIPALLDLVRGVAQRDEVTVFALRYPHQRTPYELAGARVIPFGAGQRRGFGRLAMWVRAFVALRRAAPRLDVLHALWAHEPALLALAGARASGAPVLASLLGGELVDLPAIGYGGLSERGNRHFVRHTMRHATRLSAGSEGLARMVRARAGRRCALLPLGVDPSRFHPHGAAHMLAGDPALLSVASLVPIKDHATLLAAFARLHTTLPAARLHLVGSGPLRSRLATFAGQLGIARAVHYHGKVDHGSLPELYRGADMMVVAARFESQCMAALEAAACGCPVLGTAVGIVPELGGPSVEPGDPEALASLLASAWAERFTLEGLARSQQACVTERFGLETCVRTLRAVYRELARDHPT